VLTVGFVVAIAGCVGTESEQASVEVPQITIENLDNEIHTVQVVLQTEDGATSFSQQAEIGPAEYSDGEWEKPTYVRWEDVTSSVDRYTLSVSLDNQEPTEFALPDRGSNCVAPEVEIRPDGSLTMAYFQCQS
jgi:hypothetical protein